MNISRAAALTGLPVKTIRYYDDVGLIPALRSDNGYRSYTDGHVQKLRFVGRARSLGFSLDECRSLLELYQDTNRASADVKALASQRMKQIEHKIEELNSLHQTLAQLVDSCAGDHRPDCPILESLGTNR